MAKGGDKFNNPNGERRDRIQRVNNRLKTQIEANSGGKLSICKECGKPFEQKWMPNLEKFTQYNSCDKCRTSVARGASKATIAYAPHPKQVLVHESKARFKCLVAGARFGKDRCMIMEFIMKFAEMLSEERGSDMIPSVHGWIIAPTYILARQVWRELKAFFPREWVTDLWESDKMVQTVNGGMIEVRSADDPNSLVGVGLDIVLITEAARIRNFDEVWSNLEMRLASPGRGPNGQGGLGLVNSCVVADTMVFTENGMVRIGDISTVRTPRTFVPFGVKVSGFSGDSQLATDFYCNGWSKTRKISTRSNYELEGTLNHPVWVMDSDGNQKWKQLGDLVVGDYIGIRRGMDIWGNNDDISGFVYTNKRKRPKDHGEDVDLSQMTPDLAYLMGLILGDGHIDFRANKVNIAHSEEEQETIDFLLSKPHRLNFYRSNHQHTEACSKQFVSFLEWYGFTRKKAKEKTIPKRLFGASRKTIANFLSGLFDADGHARKRRGEVGFTSTSKRLIDEIRMLLLNFGIISSVRESHIKPTKKVLVESHIWQIEITGSDSKRFYDEIGFRLTRKQQRINELKNCRPGKDVIPHQQERLRRILKGAWYQKGKTGKGLYSIKNGIGYERARTYLNICSGSFAVEDLAALRSICNDHYFWDEVKAIESGYAETFDFHIPTTHAFVSNGIISHNTPKGLGFFYDMFKWGQKDTPYYDEDWESWQFSSWDNPYLMRKDKKFLEGIKKRFPARIYAQEVEGQFLPEGNCMFPTADECAIYIGTGAVEPGESYVIGYDPAKSIDYSGVVVRNSRGETVYIKQWSGWGWDRQFDEIAKLSRIYNHAPVVMDRTGLGETIPSQLSKRGLEVEDVFFSPKEKENMVNNLAMLIEQKRISYPKFEPLLLEFKDYQYSISPKTKSISFGNASKNGHDDLVTAMMLAYKNFDINDNIIPFIGAIGGVSKRRKIS